MSLNITEIHDLFDEYTRLVKGAVQQNQWEQKLIMPAHIGSGSITRTHIRPGMEIMLTDVTFAQDMKVNIEEGCQLFELSYCASGEIYCEWSGKHSITQAKNGNVLYLEDVRVNEEKKAGVRNHLVEIRFTPEGLLHYAVDSSERNKMERWLKHYRGNIDDYSITPAIQKCVAEMMHCSHNGSMKRLYMESKAMEFIALFSETDGYGVIGGSLLLQRDDMIKLQLARELVQKHFEQPLSIRELAKRIGMNEFKLKKGFRELFGMTIFELVRQARMEKAIWYMETAHLNVGETAVSVGYNNVSNFTAIFRKHYGCNPSEYIKQLQHAELEKNKVK